MKPSMKRAIKLMKKRGKDIFKLIAELSLLASGKPMPPEYRDHQLLCNFNDFLKEYRRKWAVDISNF